MKLADITAWLDEYLMIQDPSEFPGAFNGLQVENAGEVSRVAVAVDSCQAVIDAAVAHQVQLLIVHHGLFWGGAEPLTGRAYRRIATLIRHGIAVYSAHLPLDRHTEVGNNAVLARLLGMRVDGWWGKEQPPLGVRGELDLSREELCARLAAALGARPPVLLPGGPPRAGRVGIVTGAAGSMIGEAHAAGLDTFITGEGKHHHFFDAEELGINVIFAGHYATETVGVKALAAKLSARFSIPCQFIDHPTGL